MNRNGCINAGNSVPTDRYAAMRRLDDSLTKMTAALWQLVRRAESHAQSVSGPDSEPTIDRDTRG